MFVFLLALAALAEPATFLTPSTVVRTDAAFASDFEPGRGMSGLTVPNQGASLAKDADDTVLQLEPTARKPVDAWIDLPAAAQGKWLVIRFRARTVGSATEPVSLELAPVYGSRPPASAPAFARLSQPLAEAWTDCRLSGWMAAPSDLLAVRAPAGAPAVQLDDVAIEVVTTIRDERIAELAERGGNLVLNGGFEGGTAGFLAVGRHDSLAPGDAPLPSGLRTSDRDAHEGQQAAFGMVGSASLVVTADAVVLKSGSKYTFSLAARALSPQGGRLTLDLVAPDGSSLGYTEAALGFDWRRIATAIEPRGNIPTPYTPRITVLPSQTPYPLQLDAVCVREGESADYIAPSAPLLTLRDGLEPQLGPGHVTSPEQPFELRATYLAESGEAGPVTIRAWADARLGRERRELPGAEVQTEPGVQIEVPLWSEPLPAGWYRFAVEAVSAERVIARSELCVASLRPVDGPEPWRLAVHWSVPDVLYPGPFAGLLLGPQKAYGITTRWFCGNAAALWRGLEPQPGNIQAEPLKAMIAGGRAAGLGEVLELRPFPPAGDAPDWLRRAATSLPGDCLDPGAEAWGRYVTGLTRAIAEVRPEIAVSEPPESLAAEHAARVESLREAMAAVAPEWQPLCPAGERWWMLPGVESGPLEADVVEPGEGFAPVDPLAAEAARAVALCRGLAAGRHDFRLPNEGFIPVGDADLRHGGLTTTDLGPRPFVAVWNTMRGVLGARELTGTSGREGGVRLLLYSGGAAVIWNEGEPCEAALELGAAARIRLATGETIERTAEGVTPLVLEAWPLFADGLSDADVAVLGEVITRL